MLFQQLTTREKLDFFINCQKILIQWHPESEFVTRESNLAARIEHVGELVRNYNGLVHSSDKLCVLYNKIFVKDASDPVAAMRDAQYKEPDPNFNAVLIDFAAFSDLSAAQDWCKSIYEPRIEWILFTRQGRVKIHKTQNFLAALFDVKDPPLKGAGL
jgi:hypothetical protein